MGKLSSYTEVKKVFGERQGEPDSGIIEVYYAEDGQIKGIAYVCPCGCDRTIWTPIKNGEKEPGYCQYQDLTLTPSVRWMCGCNAHFNITKGLVVWHGDSGKRP